MLRAVFAVLLCALGWVTAAPAAGKSLSPYTTGFVKWQAADGGFVAWQRTGVVVVADGTMRLEPSAAVAGTDPFGPGYNASVQRTYRRSQLESQWLETSGATAYLIYPPGMQVPNSVESHTARQAEPAQPVSSPSIRSPR